MYLSQVDTCSHLGARVRSVVWAFAVEDAGFEILNMVPRIRKNFQNRMMSSERLIRTSAKTESDWFLYRADHNARIAGSAELARLVVRSQAGCRTNSGRAEANDWVNRRKRVGAQRRWNEH